MMAGFKGFLGLSSSFAFSAAWELAFAPPAGSAGVFALLARVFFLVVAFFVAVFCLAVVLGAASFLGFAGESEVVACVTSSFLACFLAESALPDVFFAEGSALRLLVGAALAFALALGASPGVET